MVAFLFVYFVSMPAFRLLTLLADGRAHHITELARAIERVPQQLNSIWQQVPAHLQPLLRQRDGVWQLSRPLAWLDDAANLAPFALTVLRETTSSNDVLLNAARNGESIHRKVVVAHRQSAGRGRQGRTWQHRVGECLMFSVGWTMSAAQSQVGAVTLVVALACQQALAKLGCEVQIKWPNDLVIGLDKLGGILVESVRHNGQTHLVIGIGINFLSSPNVEQIAAVQAACTSKPTAHDVLNEVVQQLNDLLPQFEQQGFAPMQAVYEAAHRDQQQDVVLLNDGVLQHQGRVLGIDDTGALRLQTQSGEQKIVSGEISLRRPEQCAVPTQPTESHYLLLDGGNSRLKWAWVQNGEILQTHAAHYRDLTALANDWQRHSQPHTRIIGSAVCDAEKLQQVQAVLPLPIQWLGSMEQALGIRNHYRHVNEHGADRWFNVLGSRKFTQNACVVVSCGTAVTVDALTHNNHYLGGSIMPGFYLMRESLLRRTAQLNRPEGEYYEFPTTTSNAITTGMTDAICGAIMMIHARLQQRTHTQVDIIITGGGALKVAKALPERFVLDNNVKIVDNLVIFGLLNWINQQ